MALFVFPNTKSRGDLGVPETTRTKDPGNNRWVSRRRRSVPVGFFMLVVGTSVLIKNLLLVTPVGAAAFCWETTQPKSQRKSYSGSEFLVARSTAVPTPPRPLPVLFSTKDERNEEDESSDEISLEDKLVWIEALEERNKAQLDSFIDEKDQWESLEDWERELLLSKDSILRQLDEQQNK